MTWRTSRTSSATSSASRRPGRRRARPTPAGGGQTGLPSVGVGEGEIAVLKLIGARDSSIALMILQQAIALGLIGYAVGQISATLWAPFFPKTVLLESGDAVRGLVVTLIVCALASVLAIRAALRMILIS